MYPAKTHNQKLNPDNIYSGQKLKNGLRVETKGDAKRQSTVCIGMRYSRTCPSSYTPESISIFTTTGPDSLDALCLNSAAYFAGSQYCSSQVDDFTMRMTYEVDDRNQIFHKLEYEGKHLQPHAGRANPLSPNMLDKQRHLWHCSLGNMIWYNQNTSLEIIISIFA